MPQTQMEVVEVVHRRQEQQVLTERMGGQEALEVLVAMVEQEALHLIVKLVVVEMVVK